MAERKTDLKGVPSSVFENDFGDEPGTDFELTDYEFEFMAKHKVRPEDCKDADERKRYEAYLKKNKVKL